jgi:hypothetical protein
MDNFKYENRSEVLMYGIDNLMCIKDPDFSLQGNYYSDRFRYLQLKLQRCREKDCYNSSKIDSFFRALSLSVAFVNQYFDYNDYEKPLKTFIDDSVFFTLEKDRVKKANLYMMRSEV